MYEPHGDVIAAWEQVLLRGLEGSRSRSFDTNMVIHDA